MLFSRSKAPSSKNNVYAWHGTLQGHLGPIISLGATDDGKLLASGGEYRNPRNQLEVD